MRASFLALLLACAEPSAIPADPPVAIYHNARVHTMDSKRPSARAVAVAADGTIAAVGEDEAVLALRGPSTRIVDLSSRTVVPGLIDAHAHLYGDALRNVPLALTNLKQAIIEKIAYYSSLGITSVHEPGNADLSSNGITQREVYREIQREGKLSVRIRMMRYPPLGPKDEPEGDDWIRVGGVKLRLDFDMASRRALLLEPYSDDPATRGEKFMSFDDLVERIKEAHHAGFQVAVHAIGDGANRMALDAFQKVSSLMSPNQTPRWRPRIEHAQMIHPEDLPRFSQLGVIASMQPVHCVQDQRWIRQRIGEKRFRGAYAWKTLLQSGCVLAFGSDTPVESPDPFLGIHAAVTRQGWMPDECLSAEQALRAYTLGAAYAGFEEKTKGSLEPGKVADFVVLSQDILTVPHNAIPKTQVLLTVVNGREVFKR
jgi:hypothetical protein